MKLTSHLENYKISGTRTTAINNSLEFLFVVLDEFSKPKEKKRGKLASSLLFELIVLNRWTKSGCSSSKTSRKKCFDNRQLAAADTTDKRN